MKWRALLVCFFALLCLAEAFVDFENSLLYDEKDFEGEKEVYLNDYCMDGCRVYISVPIASRGDAMNMYLQGMMQGKTWQESILAISDLHAENGQKGYYKVLEGNTDIIIKNDNLLAEASPILIWVIKATVREIAQVYNASYIYLSPAPAEIITLLNAEPYVLKTETPMKVRIITAGYDALNEIDGCKEVLVQDNPSSYNDIRVWIRNPLVTLTFDGDVRTTVGILAQPDSVDNLNLETPSFVTSPGYIGCYTKLGAKRTRNYRSSLYASLPRGYDLKSSRELRVNLTSELNIDYDNQVVFTNRHDNGDVENFRWFGSPTTGSNEKTDEIASSGLTITWLSMDQWTDESFLIRVTPVGVAISTGTSTGTTLKAVSSTTTTVKPTSPTVRPTTTLRVGSNTGTTAKTAGTTTTSASVENIDNYCNCGIANGWFDGWNPLDIWVDVVILLDVSASMGNSLEEAKSLILSFVSLLSTDTNAELYSRVGVIAISDTAEVIYNLNMSSTDNLNMAKQHNINKIDIAAGIEAAQKMFVRGMFVPTYRSNARQIIYYLTNSAPGANMNGVNEFKGNGGIIIVNDYVIEGQVATPGLHSIASDHFYFLALKENYMRSLSVLCEANCYCNANKHAFNDDKMSPRTQANRGCFHPVDNGIPFSFARDTCRNENSALVSIHDEDKEFFVSSVISTFGVRKKYWIAYHYNGTQWIWEDQSSDPFTDWDVDQPEMNGGDALCAYATQATGLNVKWRAVNCASPMLYVCESEPCRVGSSSC